MLFALAKTNFKNLEGIFKEHINRMIGFTQFARLNCLCWAIGTISGAIPRGQEKGFLINVLRNLLNLVEQH